MITKRSSVSHAEAVERLLAALEARGLKVFATFDHAAAAREVGMELPEEKVIVFGNPRAGTPLMQSDPRIGIELPLRILVWEAQEEVLLGYEDPRSLADRYEVSAHAGGLDQMAGLLDGLATEAAGR
jgi:uncharacterized protein (DUF302 family)